VKFWDSYSNLYVRGIEVAREVMGAPEVSERAENFEMEVKQKSKGSHDHDIPLSPAGMKTMRS